MPICMKKKIRNFYFPDRTMFRTHKMTLFDRRLKKIHIFSQIAWFELFIPLYCVELPTEQTYNEKFSSKTDISEDRRHFPYCRPTAVGLPRPYLGTGSNKIRLAWTHFQHFG